MGMMHLQGGKGWPPGGAQGIDVKRCEQKGPERHDARSMGGL